MTRIHDFRRVYFWCFDSSAVLDTMKIHLSVPVLGPNESIMRQLHEFVKEDRRHQLPRELRATRTIIVLLNMICNK